MEKRYFTDHELKLSTYGRRIRHMKALSIKNLSYKCADVNQLEVYFTLHANPTSAEFYKSEAVRGTINLSWNSIDVRHVPFHYTALHLVCLRVWVNEGEATPKVHLVYDLDLHRLVLSTSAPNAEGKGSELNGESSLSDIVTFSMFGAIFELPSAADNLKTQEYFYLPTDQTLRLSYSCNQLTRLQTVVRALKQTEQSMVRVKEDINCRMVERKALTEKQKRVESGKVTVDAIKTKLDQKRQILLTKRSRVAVRHSETNKHEKEIDVKQKDMRDDDVHFTDVKSDYYSSRERLLKGNALLSQRHKQLIHELCLIYPIEQMVDGRYTIAGVYLPSAETVNSQNELASSTSLGYTSHLVNMISRFLEIPLEYPIEFRGSRSLIYDMARRSPLHPSQKDRSFPLYSRGKDKRLFQYAAQLLNKNIDNLRHAYDLPTKDIKLNLRNLKDFLHSKFGIGLISQTQQESRSPPPPLQRAVSVPGIRPPSMKAIGRTQTFVTAWSSHVTDSPNEEYSSDETLSRALTNAPAVAPHYQYDSSNLPPKEVLTSAKDSPDFSRPPAVNLDNNQQLHLSVNDNVSAPFEEICDSSQQVATDDNEQVLVLQIDQKEVQTLAVEASNQETGDVAQVTQPDISSPPDVSSLKSASHTRQQITKHLAIDDAEKQQMGSEPVSVKIHNSNGLEEEQMAALANGVNLEASNNNGSREHDGLNEKCSADDNSRLNGFSNIKK